MTAPERWEEQSGYSLIAGLVCAAEFARTRVSPETADFVLAYADWFAAHVAEWCVTSRGELLPAHMMGDGRKWIVRAAFCGSADR